MAKVEFCGEEFETSNSIALMALMRFAVVAKQGTDSNDLGGLVAMYELLEQCFDGDEFERFQQTALRSKAKGDELMAVVGKVIEAISARPTGQPSDSSDGQPSTPPSSEGASYLRVVEREEQSGRPDRAAIVLMANSA